MTESQRKWLTEYIGECWHDPQIFACDDGSYFIRCTKCKNPAKTYTTLRTFSTWADLGAGMEAIQKKGWEEWDSFSYFAHGEWVAYEGADVPSYKECRRDFTAWLFTPSRFFELVCRWKGVE